MNTIFVLGHPHTRTSPEFFHHGFTTKIWNLCKIFSGLGRKVVHLGCEGSCPPGAEHVDVASRSDWDASVGPEACLPPDPDGPATDVSARTARLAAYDREYASRCRVEIAARCDRPNQAVVAVTWGGPQWDAVAGLQQVVLEAGIGYYPATRQRWRVWESHYWAAFVRGLEGQRGGDYWDEKVIPNATDPDLYEFRERKDDYLLMLGRMNPDKGVEVAVRVAEHMGRRLILAGTPGMGLKSVEGKKCVEFLPLVSAEKKRELLAGASALLAPTRYPEPFGAVVVEAGMSGTPVVTTDWGAFVETVDHGATGFRCHAFRQFVAAVERAGEISPSRCREWATNRYSPSAVSPAWGEYLDYLDTMYGTSEGWYSCPPATSRKE